MEYQIDIATGCWNWQKTVSRSNGYGVKHTSNGSTTTAHRYVYQEMRGQIADGLELDHLCRNKRCVNPAHLEPVTHQENMRRHFQTRVMPNKCKNGHELDGTRTRHGGGRYCKTCVKHSKQRQRATK